MAQAQAQTAAHAVSEILRSPDDLIKISAIRKRLESERASIEAKLKSGAKDQLDATRDGLIKLRETKDAIVKIREEMVNVERLCEDPKTGIEGFSMISEVSRVHRQFGQTLEMVESLRSMYDKIDKLEEMLFYEKNHPNGAQENLLFIHYHLTQLEAFRNETIFQAKRTTPEARQRLEKYFDRLNILITAFDEHYLDLASRIVVIARKGHPGVAVKLAKIAEVEGARDEKATAVKLIKKRNMEIASRFKSMQAEARVIKHYRAKVMDAIKNISKKRLQDQFDKVKGNAAAMFSQLDWFYADLVFVEDNLATRFPPDWNIYPTFVKAYHKSLYDLIKSIKDEKPEAGTLLHLSQFCKEYNKTMSKDLEIPPELMEPNLLDGKEGDLIEDYLKAVRKKMDEWTSNLMRSEVQEFQKRESEPDIDAEGQYLMQGAPILFEMINGQTELALDSNQGAVVVKVVEEFNRTMKHIQASWLRIIDGEFNRQVNTPDQVPGGLVEYLMALANDQVKSADFTEALSGRLESMVSDKYKGPIADKLNDAMDGYLNVAKRCIQILIDTIFNDIKPPVRMLFTPSWYVDDPLFQIAETTKDYMADYKERLSPSLFDLLADDIVDTYLITYITALRRATKLKMPATVHKMREERQRAVEFFLEYKSQDELEQYFTVVDDCIRILATSKQMFYLDYHAFAKRYGTASTLTFVEGLLKARGDLDKGDVKDIMESIRRKAPEPEPEYPSIFTRLPIERGALAAVGAALPTQFSIPALRM